MNGLNKKMDFARTNSICPPPETVLFESVKRNEIQNIKTIVQNNKSLLDHVYTETAKSILPTACCDPEVSPSTVQTLIDLGASLEGNSQWRPLHLAAQNPNSLILEVILKNLQPGQMNETIDGDNALHYLIRDLEEDDEELYQKNVQMLLEAGINVNEGDGNNVSPILRAAKKGLKLTVKTILEKSIVAHVDIDTHKLRNKNARTIITENNLYDGTLPDRTRFKIPKNKLFALIKESKEDAFIKYFDTLSLTTPSDIVNSDDSSGTLLQHACEKGLTKVVNRLLAEGCNVNLYVKNKPKPPIDIVTEHGYFDIFKLLIQHSDLIMTSNILSYLLKKIDSFKIDNVNHEECCHILLEKLKTNRTLIDVNEEDELGNTPIHYSLRYANEATSQKLLDLGASLATKNPFGVMPIEDIKPEFLERHLNDCIKFNLKNKNDEKRDFEVIFDYSTLLPPKKVKEIKFEDSDPEDNQSVDRVLPETEVIFYMSQAPEFKALIKHPVIVSFLFMKWHRIRWLFYSNLLFYILFVLSLVTYIFSYYDDLGSGEPSDVCVALSKVAWFFLNLLFWILVFREFFQITVSPSTYFYNFENLVEIILIVITGMILYINSPASDTRKQLSSISILLAAFELVLMVGQHPKLSTNVVMLKTVSVNFFKLLLWYSLLIVAFALSFYILFAKTEISRSGNETETNKLSTGVGKSLCNESDAEKEDDDLFTGPGKSLFKTIVMLTGEFDASSINFHTYPITSKLIFSLFVFMITIILLNLLNGLAVSDTQTIKNDAELVGHISRAEHIYYVECMLLGNIIPTSAMRVIQKLCCCCPCDRNMTYTFFKPLAKKICLFSNPHNCQLLVLPNSYGQIYCDVDGIGKRRHKPYVSCARTCSETYLNKDTIRRIVSIVKNRRENLESSSSSNNIEGLYAEIAALKIKLDQVLTSVLRQQPNTIS